MHTRPYLNTRETPGLSSKPRNFFIGQIRLNRHQTQTRQFILKTVKSADISLRDRDDLLKLFDRLIKVGRLGRCDFQCVDRIIGGQNFPVFIHDDAAAGRMSRLRFAVCFSLGHKLVVLENLQIGKAAGEN